jgi:hypothetical protein
MSKCFINIMVKISYISMRWYWCPLCTRPTHMVGSLYIVLAHCNNSLWVGMWLLLPMCCLFTQEAANTSSVDIDLIHIYCTWVKHARKCSLNLKMHPILWKDIEALWNKEIYNFCKFFKSLCVQVLNKLSMFPLQRNTVVV